MIIEIYILLALLYLFIDSYLFSENIALKYWGRKLSDSPSEEEEIQEIVNSGQNRAYAKSFVKAKNIKSDASRMDPITPKVTVFLSYINIVILICFVVLGFFIFQWYINIPITIVIWFLGKYFSKFLPKENSRFWFNRFYNSLALRKKYYLSKNNFLKASACEYYIDKLREYLDENSNNDEFSPNFPDSNEISEYVSQEITDYTEAIEKAPDNPELYFNRGNIYKKLQLYSKAIEDYTTAIEISPNYAEAFNNRGNVYDDIEEFEKAIGDYTKAIEINPLYSGAYNNRGYVYNNLDNFDKAISDFSTAIQINPNFADPYNNRGILYYKTLDFTNAVSDFSKAIERNKDFSKAYNNRGLALVAGFKDYTNAITDYSIAIELNPNSSSAYLNRGLAYYMSGITIKSCDDWKKAYSLGNIKAKELLDKYCE